MMKRLGGMEVLALALVAAVAVSCASTGGDVDVTPTLRTSVDAHIGKNFTSDGKNVENMTSSFTPNETVFAVVDVPGRVDGTLKIRWLYGNELLDEQNVALQSGINVYPFRLMAPAGGHRMGEYRFEVWINNDRSESETFNVVAG